MPDPEPPTSLIELIGLLSRQLNIRLTFFDCTGAEQVSATGRPHSDFCLRHRREDPEFDARCVRCDLEHLAEARRTRREVIYCCHAGLLDGVVPLYSRRGLYLGGLVFGQIRREESALPAEGVRTGTPEMMCEIARLLRIVGEHIIQQEMIHLHRPHWVDAASEYIDRNFHRKITLKELAARTGCSTSYLSHHFPAEFGMPLRAYLRRLRLEKARLLVERGLTLKEIAAETGFYDEFHLSKAFKQFFGVPPSQLQ